MKSKTTFVCQSCGTSSPKWMGKCPACGEWGSLVEEAVEEKRPSPAFSAEGPQPLDAIAVDNELRTGCRIRELDRVLGGGLVAGSVVLIGGDPGIGKSTLMLQALGCLAENGLKVLYVSGEESARQIRLRSERLGVSSPSILVLTETNVEHVLKAAADVQPGVIVVDSIQTMYSENLSSTPGSVSQVRESASRFVTFAKRGGAATFLVGHVTKEGSIAGPRVLEHMVDTVLYFEGDRSHAFRILRAVKNRFGSTNEIGVFQMKESGLVEVNNPSSVFLAERPLNVSGSVVSPCMEGTRPILVELQALVSSSNGGTPRRTTIGADASRVSLLVAVLEKKIGLCLGDQDVFINVAGGVKADEPAIDLGLAAAMASSFLDRAVPPRTVLIGEVGLAGEIRGVSQIESRLTEARKLGFNRCILPKSSIAQTKPSVDMELVGVQSVGQALEEVLS